MHAAVLLLLALMLAAGCGDRPASPAPPPTTPSAPAGKPVVFAVNDPLAYFARRIAGDTIQMLDLIPRDVDPAYWRPEPDAVVRIQAADLILLNGAGYARWVATTTLPESRMVDTSSAFADRLIHVPDLVTHSHGTEGAHSHGGVATIFWLDASLAQEQARAAHAALHARLPTQGPALDAALQSLLADLEALDRRWRSWGQAVGRRPLLASHPVYHYLERRCELNLASLHWEPDQVPDDKAWQELKTLLASHAAAWMLWEAEPLPDVAQRLASMGIRSVVVAPCGNRSGEGDFLTAMNRNLDRLEAMLSMNRIE